jgi:hypothetical protein
MNARRFGPMDIRFPPSQAIIAREAVGGTGVEAGFLTFIGSECPDLKGRSSKRADRATNLSAVATSLADGKSSVASQNGIGVWNEMARPVISFVNARPGGFQRVTYTQKAGDTPA